MGPMPVLSQPTRWSSVILLMASTWLVASCTEEMLSPRMSMLPLPPSRPREASNLLTGVQLDSRLVLTTSLQPSSPEAIRLRTRELSVCCPTQLLLLKPGQDLTTSLTLCMPRELLFTGMLERVWKRESSLRPEKILLLLRRIMKRLDLTALMLEMMVAKSTRFVWMIPSIETGTFLHAFIGFQE